MKKYIFFCLTAVMMTAVAVAQTVIDPQSPSVLQSGRWSVAQQGHRNAPALIDLPENQMILSHYESDALATEGEAMSNTGMTPLGIVLEPEELAVFQGGQIKAFRIGLVDSAHVYSVFVVPISAKGKYGSMIDWTCDLDCEPGWNTVQLETPYEINLGANEKLLVGFYYEQALDAKPLSLVQEGIPYDTYTYTRVGSVGKWKPVGFIDKGNLSIQCIVESDHFPDYSITTYNMMIGNYYVQRGNDIEFAFEAKNQGTKPIEAGELTMNVLIDGRQVATIINDKPFEGGHFECESVVSTAGLESGEHVLTVQPATVDGVELESAFGGNITFMVYKRGFPRQKHLVEQITSTYCTYCPLGSSMLTLLTSQRDDVAWVGIHGNLGTGVDPFRSDQCDSIMSILMNGSISYPSGTFDRATGLIDNKQIAIGLGFYPEDHQWVADILSEFFDYLTELTPTFAEIKGNCSYNSSTRMATVTVCGHISPDYKLMLGEDAAITVYLVEDSLVSRQINLGNWDYNYVHNGVVRQALGSIYGLKPNMISDGYYKNTFRFEVPKNWKLKNLRVVAFISPSLGNLDNRLAHLMVNNAEILHFTESDGVNEVINDRDAYPVEYYDIMGRRHEQMQPGINIVKMSDGSAKKILVK